MFSWRLVGLGLATLLAGAFVSLALSAPGGQTLMSAPPLLMSATPIVREFPVVTNTATQGSPAISGNLVVWQDRDDCCRSDIYGKDLATGREFAVVTNTAWQTTAAIGGSIVVWEDDRNDPSCAPFVGYPPNCDIYGKNLAIGQEFAVVTHTDWQGLPATSGNLVVWVDRRNSGSCNPPEHTGNCDIYGKDLASGREFAVVTNSAYQGHPAISGNIVVWEDNRNGNWDIYGKNLSTGEEFAVVTYTSVQYEPAISGNLVVWDDYRNGNHDIYGKDLATGREFAVVTHPAWQTSPAISGNLVVWSDCRNDPPDCEGSFGDIYGKNLAAWQEFAVATNTAYHLRAAISGNVVVWQDRRNGNWDIYGARLEWPPAPGACSLTGTVRGQGGAYYLEEAGRMLAFLYGESVNFPAYLGQRVTVGGPCRVWQESQGPRPVFLAQTILTVANQSEPQPSARPKASRGATRSW